MHAGLLTDSVAHLELEPMLDLAAELGLASIELAAGNWSTAPHLDVRRLLNDSHEAARLLAAVESRGMTISALNASGNPLHPVHGQAWDAKTRDVMRLAGELGVGTVVLMSGLPAGAPGDSMPNWVTTSWPPETTVMRDYQWGIVLDYWSDLTRFAETTGITRLAVEMHANQVVFSVPGVQRLRETFGPLIGANLDPSHLMWMGADPLAAVDALAGAIYHVHAKDTRIENRVRVRSVMDPLTVAHVEERAWNFVTVGRGHPVKWWTEFVRRLDASGYAGALSIEHEDAEVDGVAGVREAASVLQRALS